jgi:hypothetical protein
MKNSQEENINTTKYWENRFGSGDWEEKGGRIQTASFANAQVRHFLFNKNFDGVLIDFGCGLGDAIPVYHQFFPEAKLIGLDVSESAIQKCKARYGRFAEFIHGTHSDCPSADVIVASNVFEHLSGDIEIAKNLLGKCRELYITVPYKEWPLCSEHVRSYNEDYFRILGEYDYVIFPSRGWSEYNSSLAKLKLRNLAASFFGGAIRERKMQIMFRFFGLQSRCAHK